MLYGGLAEATSSAKLAANGRQALDGKGLTIPPPVAKQNIVSCGLIVHCGMAGNAFIPDAEASQSICRRQGISGASAQEEVRSMDAPKNDSHRANRPPPESASSSPHKPDEQHAVEPIGVGKRPALSLRVRCELARRLAYVSEAREARIRELQDAIKNDTYHVPAEQIADTMLRSTLRDDLA
jgi:Anti-sigma-28 factor, FlgM